MRRIIGILSILDLLDLIVAVTVGGGALALALTTGGRFPALASAGNLLRPLPLCPASPTCILPGGSLALSGALLAAIIAALAAADSRRSGRGAWFALFLVLAVLLVLSPFTSVAMQSTKGIAGFSATVIVSFVVAVAGLAYGFIGGSAQAKG
jgi:hypothetical protein